jgi:hypothetical protein
MFKFKNCNVITDFQLGEEMCSTWYFLDKKYTRQNAMLA